MKLVKQRHRNGCVSAAIATITKHSYIKVFRLFNKKKKPFYNGVTYPKAIKVLNSLKIPFKIFYSKKKLFKNNSIILVKVDEYKSHAIVWDHSKQKILDPFPGSTGLFGYKINKLYCFAFAKLIIEIY